MTKEDRRTGRQRGGGRGKRELRGGDVPSRRVSRSFPSRWPQRREEEGEGGERRLRAFFFI